MESDRLGYDGRGDPIRDACRPESMTRIRARRGCIIPDDEEDEEERAA